MGSTILGSFDTSTRLLSSVRRMLDRPPRSDDYWIYRVPKGLRDTNEDAYMPQLVSIGPFHHGSKSLRDSEEYKLRYCQDFLSRTNLDLERFVRVTPTLEQKARKYYAGTIELGSDDFRLMVLVDGIFIIEVMLKFESSKSEGGKSINDLWFIKDVRSDLILLENQLPFSVLQDIFNLAFPDNGREEVHSLLELSLQYFDDLMMGHVEKDNIPAAEVKHFVDLLRTCHLPPRTREFPAKSVKYVPIHNATELQEAGIKFECADPGIHLLEIRFDGSAGVLEIPCLAIKDTTEIVLRNLIALELCCYMNDSYIIDYVHFMSNLIDTPKDVDLLAKSNVIENRTGDKFLVAPLFNSLTTEVLLKKIHYHYYRISEYLNEYSKVPWYGWKATLKREYFSTPLRIASSITAVIIVVLTLIQTVCSIMSLF